MASFTEIEEGYIRNSVQNGIAVEVMAKTLGRQVKTVKRFIADNDITAELSEKKEAQPLERSARVERKLSQMRSGPATVMTAAASEQADAQYNKSAGRTSNRVKDCIDRPKG